MDLPVDILSDPTSQDDRDPLQGSYTMICTDLFAFPQVLTYVLMCI